jgi:ornithine decarboxylase
MAPSLFEVSPYTENTVLDHTNRLKADNQIVGSNDGVTNALSKCLIGNSLRKRVESINDDTCDAGDEDAFFVADLGEVYRQHLRWNKCLDRVKPHYGQFLL